MRTLWQDYQHLRKAIQGLDGAVATLLHDIGHAAPQADIDALYQAMNEVQTQMVDLKVTIENTPPPPTATE